MNKDEAILKLKEIFKGVKADGLNKSYVAPTGGPTTGLQGYDLESGVLELYPEHLFFVNKLARDVSGFGAQANWKAYTGININNESFGVPERERGGIVEHQLAEYFASYKTLGLEDFVTDEALASSKTFIDLLSEASSKLINSAYIKEEMTTMGGNGTQALGVTPTPTATGANTGGSLAAGTFNIACVALSQEGWQQVAGWNNGIANGGIKLNAAIVAKRTINGTSRMANRGVAQKSAFATATTTGAVGSITASVANVNGAFGYAWYVGPTGQEKLAAVSSINSVVITSLNATGQNISALPAEDCSKNELVYDGFLTIITNPNSNSYVRNLDTGVAGIGSKLTSNGVGGCLEVDEAFNHFWENHQVTPTHLIMTNKVAMALTKCYIDAGGVMFQGALSGNGSATASIVVKHYTDPVNGKVIPIIIHPNAAPGTIMFYTESIDYSLPGVANLNKMKLRYDYRLEEFPRTKRSYDYGIYMDGVLQCYFPPSMGLIRNIAA